MNENNQRRPWKRFIFITSSHSRFFAKPRKRNFFHFPPLNYRKPSIGHNRPAHTCYPAKRPDNGRKRLLTLVIPLGALLQAYIQIDNSHVPRGATQATLLVGAGARLAGLMARLADALGVRVASRRARRHARPVTERGIKMAVVMGDGGVIVGLESSGRIA